MKLEKRMMMLDRMRRPEPHGEYGGKTERRMIGYDRDSPGMRHAPEYPPMNGYMGGTMPQYGWPHYPPMGGGYDDPEMRRRRDGRGRYMMGGMDDDDDDPRGYSPRATRGNSYGDIYARGTIYAPGAMNRPGGERGSKGDMSAPVDEYEAREWVRGMSGGEHFKLEHSEQYRAVACPDCDKWEFYVAINAMYNDHCETAKKMGVDKPEFYAHLAKDFLKDEDAAPHKLRKYMETIPK